MRFAWHHGSFGLFKRFAGKLGHSASVSLRLGHFLFAVFLVFNPLLSTMSVTKEVRDFISNSLAENNRALLAQISKLVSDSAENLKRANAEAADEQLRQVKKLREEPKSFKRKGNEIQYKFNSKLQDSLEEAKTHLETNAVEKAKESLIEGTLLLTNRQKLILFR